MKAKTMLILTMFIFFSIVSYMNIVVAETTDYVGVKSGDWIKYRHTITDIATNASVVTSMEVQIINVSGTVVTVEQTTISYGIRDSERGTIDVVTGSHDHILSPCLIIPAVNPEIPVFLSGSDVIDSGETTRTYIGQSRVILYARTRRWTGVVYENSTYYWDKQTGVLMEVSIIGNIRTFNLKATETNMWKGQPFGLPIVFYVLIIVAIVPILIVTTVIIIVMRRRKKPPEEIVPSPPPQQTWMHAC